MKRALAAAVAAGLCATAAVLVLSHLPRRTKLVVGSPTTEYAPRRQSTNPPPVELAWPTYGYDAARARAAPQPVRPPLRKLWTFHGRSLLEFPPVVGYGAVFISAFDGRLSALSTATGRTLWSYASGRCGWSSPALGDGLVVTTFIGSDECHSSFRDGEVVAFDARTGRVRWLRVVAPTESSPLIVARSVYVGDWHGTVWALDLTTGRLRWSTQLSGAIKGSLASAGRRLFIGTYDGEVASLDRRSGAVLWRSGGHGPFYSSPAVAYGRVFIGSLDHGVYAFGATTGHLLWSRPTGGYVYASPAIWNHLVLVGSYDDRFYALDAGTGGVRWSFSANGRISGAASVIGGLVYFSSFAERTYVLRAGTGALVTSWADGKYSPAVADAGHLYFVGLGRLYALVPE